MQNKDKKHIQSGQAMAAVAPAGRLKSKEGRHQRAMYNYALRIAVAPGYYEDEKIERIIAFCSRAQVDEVMLFANCEELNTGHLTVCEQRRWIQTLRKVRDALVSAGMIVSINPWETLLHADRGRKLKAGQAFNLMVDQNGQKAAATACPACAAWIGHICDTYARFAELVPHVIWIEDDFRLHNHAPLVWGGCFCDAHLRLISAEYGRSVSRQELVDALTAPGTPHPLRRLWLDLNGRIMANNARQIRDAVNRISKDTRIGLMTSYPSVHCAEGRNWDQMIASLGGASSCVIRPHLPAYTEVTPSEYVWNFNIISRQTAALLPEGIDLMPEIDNGPHSLYTKSRSMMRFQMLLSSVLCSTGLTFNIFDMIGNGPLLQEGYQDTLMETKPFLEYVQKLGLKLGQQNGIVVPFCLQSSYTIDTSPELASGSCGSVIERLYPDEGKWASMLSAYGLSTCVTTEKHHQGQIVAISGQWLRNMQPEEIIRLFEENVTVLDGTAALTLNALGLGHLAGIKSLRRIVPVSAGEVSYEEVVDGTPLSSGKQARFSAQVSCGSTAIFDYDSEAHIVTELKSYDGQSSGPGMVVFNRRCLIFPFLFPNSPHTCLLHTLRRELWVNLLGVLDNNQQRISAAEGGVYLAPYRFDLPDSSVVLIANGSTDKVSSPSLRLGGYDEGCYQAEICLSDGTISKTSLCFERGVCKLPFGIGVMDVVAVRIFLNQF